MSSSISEIGPTVDYFPKYKEVTWPWRRPL